ncbi:BlaI/MecI/CopY family transcriptional regulator [Stieleria sp. JC731]|uniref:BlaI/MecI/CopY family transcriptional regulator n=1 Tax=Pirellulaceae TaxID=2691357 RepID=UPI001E591223|nr:BlaI/MecI/CopY family transcriptional regulator [Stieleria sp. JC731]MCC9603126.1 BlaI/MecI/CopY family transcriptional regulator [Stieleria sp. JC731]
MNQLTDSEMELLEKLWELGPATIRALSRSVYQSESDSKTASVQKLLGRMMDKHYVVCDSGKRPKEYTAAISRDEFLQRQLENLATRHCGGKLMPLATALVQTKGFNKRQRQQLRKMIDELFPPDQEK